MLMICENVPVSSHFPPEVRETTHNGLAMKNAAHITTATRFLKVSHRGPPALGIWLSSGDVGRDGIARKVPDLDKVGLELRGIHSAADRIEGITI